MVALDSGSDDFDVSEEDIDPVEFTSPACRLGNYRVEGTARDDVIFWKSVEVAGYNN